MPGRPGAPGTLFVVATPIGNLEDISTRGLRVLREVALIAAEDTRRTAHLLARYAIQTPTTSLHDHNEARKTPVVVSRLLAGESVALVTDAGTPTISDPGVGLVRAAVAAGVRVEPVPGPSAAVSLLSVSGFPCDTFTFLGFPPPKAHDRSEWVEALAKERRPVVFYEAPHRIRETLLEALSKLGDCQIVVGRELTKLHEEVLRGPISQVVSALHEPSGEFVVAINLAEYHSRVVSERPTDDEVREVFGSIVADGAGSRRVAAARTAIALGLTTNEVYRIVQTGPTSVE